jgi:predicted DNA-binding protein (MmcQ/YjbR family)
MSFAPAFLFLVHKSSIQNSNEVRSCSFIYMTLSAKQLAQSTRRRDRLVEICRKLPEVTHEFVGREQEHVAFRVGKKTFAYYLFDHHGDGRIGFCCKSSLSEQRRFVRDDPESFFVPAYLGSKGWVGVRLDLDEVDWDTVNELARHAFQLSAPRKLAALIDES